MTRSHCLGLLLVLAFAAQVVAAAEDIVLRGEVVDAQGKPVAGADVIYAPGSDKANVQTGRSDSDGRFMLRLPDQGGQTGADCWGVLWVSAANYSLEYAWIDDLKPQPSPIRMALRPPGDFALKLVDPQERPLAGAVVRAKPGVEACKGAPADFPDSMFPQPPAQLAGRLTATTGSDGSAAVSAVAWDQVLQWEVVHPTYGSQRMWWDGEDHSHSPTVRVLSTAHIEGRLLADAPSAVRGVKVRVETSSPDHSGKRAWASSAVDVVTDNEGRFTTPAVVAGHYRISLPELEDAPVENRNYLPVDRPSHLPVGYTPEVVAAGETKQVEIWLAPTVRMRGVVRECGTQKPRTKLIVHCLINCGGPIDRRYYSNEALVDDQGRFEFRELPGDVIFSLSMGLDSSICSSDHEEYLGGSQRRYRLASGTKEVAVPPIDAVLIRGRVADEAGGPLPKAGVTFHWRKKRTENEVQDRVFETCPAIDDDGRFCVLTDPGCSFSLTALAESHHPERTAWATAPETPGVDLPDIVLASSRLPMRSPISGRVVDRRGTPIPGVAVFLAAHRAETVTDERGEFRLADIPRETTPVFFEKAGFRFQGRWLELTEERIGVTLVGTNERPDRIMQRQPWAAMPCREREALATSILEPFVRDILRGKYSDERFSAKDLLQYIGYLTPGYARRLLAEGVLNAEQTKAVNEGLETRPRPGVGWLWEVAEQCPPFPAWKAAWHALSHSSLYTDDNEPHRNGLAALFPPKRVEGEIDRWLETADRRIPRFAHGLRCMFYRRALAIARKIEDPEDRLDSLGCIAERLLDCGCRQEALRVFHEGEQLAMAHGDCWMAWTRAQFAERMARADVSAALRLVESLSAELRDPVMGRIAQIIAGKYPAEAERILTILRTRKHGDEAMECAPWLCHRMAAADPARARRLADGIADAARKAIAYCLIAQTIASSQPDAAADLLRQAYVVLDARAKVQLTMPTDPYLLENERIVREIEAQRALPTTGRNILYAAETVAPELVEECFWRTLSLREPLAEDAWKREDRLPDEVETDLQLVFFLYFYNRTTARAALSQVLGRMPRMSRHLASKAIVIDPEQAIAAHKDVDAETPVGELAAAAATAVLSNDDAQVWAGFELPKMPDLDRPGRPRHFHSAGPATWHDQEPGVLPDPPSEKEDPARAALPARKYFLDGLLSPQKHYKAAWTAAGRGQRNSPGGDVWVVQLLYDNDASYLYLFLKCTPSVGERFQDEGTSGSLTTVWLKRIVEASGKAPSPGAAAGDRFQIDVPLGFGCAPYFCQVVYNLSRWDASVKAFGSSIREEASYKRGALIAHGQDGVEMAVPLSELGLRPGETAQVTIGSLGEEENDSNPRATIRVK